MNSQTLYLAWQDKDRTRAWYPVGRLDSDRTRSDFRFRYTGGAEVAEREAGFPALMDFPDMHKDYRSRELFPMFRNRVIMPGRPDFADYIARLGLAGEVRRVPDMARRLKEAARMGFSRAIVHRLCTVYMAEPSPFRDTTLRSGQATAAPMAMGPPMPMAPPVRARTSCGTVVMQGTAIPPPEVTASSQRMAPSGR